MTSKRKVLLRQYLIILVGVVLLAALLSWGFYAAMSSALSKTDTEVSTQGGVS